MIDTKLIILEQVKRYPLMEVVDVTKLLYQKNFGCGHIISNKAKAKDYLKDEYELVVEDKDIPLTEYVGNGFLRINLARYKAENLEINDLFDAFYLSSKEEIKGIEGFLEDVEIFREMIEDGEVLFDLNEFDLFFNKYVDSNMPMISHSELYHDVYDPHYRIVHEKYWFIKEEK